jgi:hypothetical protein
MKNKLLLFLITCMGFSVTSQNTTSTTNLLGQGSFFELRGSDITTDSSSGINYSNSNCNGCPESRQFAIEDNKEWFELGGDIYIGQDVNDTWAVFGDSAISRLRQLVSGLTPNTTYSIRFELKKEGSEKVKEVWMGVRDFDNLHAKYKVGISEVTEVAGVSVFSNKRAEISRSAISDSEFTSFQFEYTNESATAIVFEINVASEGTSDRTLLDNVSFVKKETKLSSIAQEPQIHFTLQPNPTSEKVLLSSNKIIDKVLLFDLMGNLVSQDKSGFEKGEFSLSGVPSGVYVLEAHLGHLKEKRKLIVN